MDYILQKLLFIVTEKSMGFVKNSRTRTRANPRAKAKKIRVWNVYNWSNWKRSLTKIILIWEHHKSSQVRGRLAHRGFYLYEPRLYRVEVYWVGRFKWYPTKYINNKNLTLKFRWPGFPPFWNKNENNFNYLYTYSKIHLDK